MGVSSEIRDGHPRCGHAQPTTVAHSAKEGKPSARPSRMSWHVRPEPWTGRDVVGPAVQRVQGHLARSLHLGHASLEVGDVLLQDPVSAGRIPVEQDPDLVEAHARRLAPQDHARPAPGRRWSSAAGPPSRAPEAAARRPPSAAGRASQGRTWPRAPRWTGSLRILRLTSCQHEVRSLLSWQLLTDTHTLDHDAIVIGGGPAGLQAALTLGRVHRRTLLLDSGSYRNDPAPHMHNFLTQDGTPPGGAPGRRPEGAGGVRHGEHAVRGGDGGPAATTRRLRRRARRRGHHHPGRRPRHRRAGHPPRQARPGRAVRHRRRALPVLPRARVRRASTSRSSAPGRESRTWPAWSGRSRRG